MNRFLPLAPRPRRRFGVRGLALFLAAALASSAESPAPRLVCAAPLFDFGQRNEGDRLEHTFTLSNTGGGPLVIHDIRTNCGCTVAEMASRTLAPGEQANLTARLDLRGKRGPVQINIALSTNDPRAPRTTLILRGTSNTELLIQPSSVHFGRLEGDEVPEKEVEVSLSGTPFLIESTRSSSPHYTVGVDDLDSGRRYRVRVKVAGTLPPGVTAGQILLSTDHPKYKTLVVPVTATMPDVLEIAPAFLHFAPQGGTVNTSIMIRPGRVSAFEVTRVEVPLPEIKATLMPMGKGGFRVLLENLSPTLELSGKEIIVHTTAPGREKIVIPIQVIAPRHN